jgi:salicylate hydroxylase
MTKTVAIIGQGLTGITAGLMLAQHRYGHKNGERHDILLIGAKPRLIGGLQLAPNGLEALRAIGLYDAALDSGVRLDNIVITAMSDGRALAEIPHPQNRIYIGIGRSDLYQAIEAKLGRQKNVERIESPALSITRANDKMELVLEDGQTLYVDEIIGADGVNGLCRSFVCGAQLTAKAAPYYAMRCDIEANVLPRLFSRAQTQLILGDGCHFVSYPMAGQRRINMVFCASSEQLGPEWQAQLLAPHPILKYVADASPHWVKLPLFSNGLPASWRRMHVTLIGDAAHIMPPHLAQGAGQSFVDIAYLKAQLQEEALSDALRSMAIMRASQLKSTTSKASLTGQVMRLSGLPGQLRDSLLGLSGTHLLENWLADVWHAKH